MRKLLNILLLSFAITLCFVFVTTSCQKYSDRPNGATQGMAKVYCDESFKNVLEQEIDVFEYQYPKAFIKPRYMSELAAFDSLLNNKVDVIITSTDLTQDQKTRLSIQNRAYRSRMIAVDAVAIIVNKDNDIDELSMTELKDLFTGKYRLWGKLTPTKFRNDSIKLLFDGNATGVIRYIKSKFLGGKDFPFKVYSAHSSEEVFETIQKYKNAVGFVGVSWVAEDMGSSQKPASERYSELNKVDSVPSLIDFTNRVKVLKVRSDDRLTGVKPYQAYINDGSYPLFRKIFAIDASLLGTIDHSFFVFLTGTIGQKIILQTGIMPGAEPVRTVEAE